MTVRIGLIGDRDDSVVAHQAIPKALELAAAQTGVSLDVEWLGTDTLDPRHLPAFDALWCVPASPYRDTERALEAIGHARRGGVPFLGTCGGFQHAVIEYARNVLGWVDAGHAETDAPDSTERMVITPLVCALVEKRDAVSFVPGSRLATWYDAADSIQGYHCSYGLSPRFRDEITVGPLHVTAVDGDGDVRALELADHPFFVLTLFQPEREALAGVVPPPARALVEAAAGYRQARARSEAPVIETERLTLRELQLDDAPFIRVLVNDPSFLANVGDKGVRTLGDARRYLLDGPMASYAEHGFGLYRVTLRASGEAIGICGLLKRAELDDVEVGFAFLPEAWGQGYATEAARAALAFGRETHGLERLVAITAAGNRGSIRVLEKLGMAAQDTVQLPGDPSPVVLFGP